MLEVVNRLDRNIIEIRENEQIISDSIDLLATNLQAVQDTLEEVGWLLAYLLACCLLTY